MAIFFRFFQIMAMPGGLFPDEAAEGLDANLIQQGQLQPFYERGNGREALFYYIIAAVITFFGTGSWQLHASSAGIGLLSVLACFLMTRQLFLDGDKDKANRLALLASFFMAVSSWHVVLSRTAFRANLIPLFSALTFYFLILAWKAKTLKQQLLFSAITGAVFAGGFYSYIAYRILVPILGVLIIWPFVAGLVDKPWYGVIKKYWKSTAIAALTFIIVIFPLAYYFYTHEGSFVGRSSQVSIFNPDLNGGDLPSTFMEVTRQSLVGYFKDGDINWRHNISGQPFLSEIISPFFAIGIVTITILAFLYMLSPRKRPEYWKYALLAGSFWGLLIPSITTAEGIPHGLRSIGTIPFVFIITAWGLYKTAELVKKMIQKRHWQAENWKKHLINYSVRAMLVCFFVALILQSYFSYFIYARNSPENFYSFRSDLTQVSNYINEYGDKNNTYLVLDSFSIQTPEFLTTLDPFHPENPKNQPYQWVEPQNLKTVTNLKRNDQIVFTQSSLGDIRTLKEYYPEARLFEEQRNQFGQTILAVYKIY